MIKKIIYQLILIALCTGCTSPEIYNPCDNPPPLPDCYVPDHVRLALVLGGGGAKGLAHVGVLEEFEKAGIPIDVIIGCSAGSLVGAVYCDCPNADWVRDVLEPMKSEDFLDISIWKARFGLSQGDKMENALRCKLTAQTFDQLQIPLLIVATDLYSGELVTIGGGDIITAVRASSAIPIVYNPVQLHGRIFVDGGVIDPVPARVAKQINAEYIVAVDLGQMMPRRFPKNLFEVAKRSADIALLWQSESCLEAADLIIRPQLGEDIGCFNDENHEQIYEAGRQAARDAIPIIKQQLGLL